MKTSRYQDVAEDAKSSVVAGVREYTSELFASSATQILQAGRLVIPTIACALLVPLTVTVLAVTGVLGQVGKHNLESGEKVPPAAKAFAPFADTLGISWDDDFVYIEGNGLPQHNMMTGITAWQQQVPIPHDFTGPQGAFRIPIDPEPLETPQELTLLGPIALAVNGIPIFHSLTQSGKDAKAGGELDQWGGHCGRADDYHYHITPGHLEEVVGKGNPVAYGLDGFPVYMADPKKDKKLDEAHGYFDPDGNYRYVSGDEAPYMMAMFRGAVDLDIRPRTRGVRPHLPPLRGAEITGFEGTLADGYALHYEVNGKPAKVEYQVKDNGGVDFKFTDAAGAVREENYESRRQGGGGGGGDRRRREDDRRRGPGGGKSGPGGRGDDQRGGPPRAEGGRGQRTPWILVHAPELDADKNGTVTIAEVMTEAKTVFDGYDGDSDGKMTLAEMQGRGSGVRSALNGFVKEHNLEMDRDGDEVVSAQEMAGQFRKFFERHDGNGDGKLTKEEYAVEGDIRPRFPERQSRTGFQPVPSEGGRLEARPTSGKPNFILFYIDDMGWRDMGFALRAAEGKIGSSVTLVETPHTDRLAREGVIFTNAYSSAPNCAPARACLMSGQYTPRHGVYTVVDDRHAVGSAHHKMLAAHSNAEMATEAVTIAEQLKQGGYRTAMMGMWNLGRGSKNSVSPEGQGFELFERPQSLGFDKDRFFNDRGEYLTDRFTDEGLKFIERHRDEPFFVYFAYHAVHSPFEPKPELLAKYENKSNPQRQDPAYAATVEAVDQNVGRVMETLGRLGLAENTVVIFTSDNGGNRRHTAPLRDGKGSLYEGGIRVPACVWGPGVAKGLVSDEPILGMDFYPTMLELAGIEPNDQRDAGPGFANRSAVDGENARGHRIDGMSLVPLLDGSAESLGRDRVFWHFPCYIGGGGPSSAMRAGDWKVIEFFEDQRVELYNLAEDPGEQHDLAKRERAKAEALYADLRAWQQETGAALVTEANPDYDPNAAPKKGRDQRGKGKGGGGQKKGNKS